MVSGEEYEKLKKELQKQKLLGVLFYYFPKFETDFEKLDKNNVILYIQEKNRIFWNTTSYTKTSLCEYFKVISRTEKINWQLLEDIFDLKGLYELSKKVTDSSKDYQKIKELLKD